MRCVYCTHHVNVEKRESSAYRQCNGKFCVTQQKMPAASSKPAPQTTLSEGQDPLRQLVGIVEKKIRNLEKRKTKLDGYRATVSSGKALNKDQEEAVSHFEEVSASLEFAKELSKSFAVILNEAARAHKKEAKREKQQRHEQGRERILDVLLLQNVLYHMGQDHVRSDFLAGTNGALHLEEEEVNHLDELFKLVSPSRESDSEGETEDGTETSDAKSFERKLELATGYLDSYLKEEDKEVCGTTYKELNNLVHRIHQCGYLDSIPPVTEEPANVPEEPTPAPYEAQEEEFEEKYAESTPDYEENVNEVTTDNYYTVVSSDQMTAAAMPLDVTQMQGSIAPEQQQLNDIAPQSRVLSTAVVDVPPAPEPIEMPPPKQTHRDVNELLAPVLGSFNFVQDSMLDYDSPHMDPAVVAVSQPFIPSSTFTNNVQSSANSADKSQLDQGSQPGVMDHQTLVDTLSAQQPMGVPSQLTTEQTSYQPQPRYDGSQQNYASQGLPDQSAYSQQTLEGASTGFGTQQDLANASSVQVEYGSSKTSNDLSEFPSPPLDNQLSKQEDQSVLQGGSTSLQSSLLNQQTLSHTSSQYGASGLGSNDCFSQTLGSQSLGSNQHAGDGVTSSLSSQMNQGSSSSPLTLTDPSQANIPLPGEQQSPEVQQGSIPPTKSTMNASAPPFQMTNSMRSSPQMQQMQSSPPSQVGQSQDMGAFQSMDQSQDYDHSSSGDVDRTHSPIQDNKLDQPVVHSNEPLVNTYAGYQPYYNRNGRGNKRGGANPGFRGSRGSAPFMRGNPRYNTAQQPRGPGTYNAYVQRDAFTPRGPDLSYNPNARYGGFTQMQDQNFYSRRGGMPRGGPRGGRGAPGPRSQPPYRGGRGNFGKPTPQVSV